MEYVSTSTKQTLQIAKEYAQNGELEFNDEIVYSGFNEFWDAFMRHEYDND
jgi:hypothetical protein